MAANTKQKGRGGQRGANKPDHPYQQVLLSLDRVVRVVKGGRRFRQRALVVLGDGKGLIGVGLGKSADASTAINKAAAVAQRQMFQVVLEETSIPHEVGAKVGGARILIKPAKAGTGLIAGSVSRLILEAAGYRDIYSKNLGNSNKVNRAYATIEALKKLVARDKWPDYRQISQSSNKKPKEVKESKKTLDKKETKTV